MAGTVTVEHVRKLASQLPPAERLMLVADICADLSASAAPLLRGVVDEELARRTAEAEADSLLAELDRVAESIDGDFDAVEDIRAIRAARVEGQ